MTQTRATVSFFIYPDAVLKGKDAWVDLGCGVTIFFQSEFPVVEMRRLRDLLTAQIEKLEAAKSVSGQAPEPPAESVPADVVAVPILPVDDPTDVPF